jgi:hypothetical protein
MPVKKEDAHRALELLENYALNLTSPNDKQLKLAIEKLIHIFKSNLFQALLDIQEFYELILLDDTKDVQTKSLAVLKIAEKWMESPPIVTTATSKNDLLYSSTQRMDTNSPVSLIINDNAYDDHWSYETIILERPTSTTSLGFSIAGGSDNPIYGNNTSIFITKLTQNGIAELDGRMRINDILVKVNDINCDAADHSLVVQALKEAGTQVRLTVKRLDPPQSQIEDILLIKTQNGLGFSIAGGLFTEHVYNDHGIFITKIIKGGAADLNGRLAIGDRLLSVNDVALEYVTHEDAVGLVSSAVEQSNEVLLKIAKLNVQKLTNNKMSMSKSASFTSSQQSRQLSKNDILMIQK